MNNKNNDNCEVILRIFIKCARETDPHKKTKCKEAEKLMNSTWFSAYYNCVIRPRCGRS